MITEVALPEQVALLEKAPVGVAPRVTVVLDTTGEGFPNWSRISMVMGPEQAPATMLWVELAKTTLLGEPGWTVSTWLAWVRGGEAALTVRVPASVSLK